VAEPNAHAKAAPVDAPSGRRPRVVAAAVEPVRRAGVIEMLNRVVAAGGSGVLVTADGSPRPEGLADAVAAIDLVAGERRLGLNLLAGLHPGVWRRYRNSKPYRVLRPWLLWRVLRRRLDVVRVGDVDHVLIVHQNSWPIAWQLHHRNPAISIAYELPDGLLPAVPSTPT
jgi:hypothetical protein